MRELNNESTVQNNNQTTKSLSSMYSFIKDSFTNIHNDGDNNEDENQHNNHEK